MFSLSPREAKNHPISSISGTELVLMRFLYFSIPLVFAQQEV
jgi:hypothetical protein